DRLNDCAKRLLHASLSNWDNNGDGIPDAIALQWGLPVVGLLKVGDADPDADGVTNVMELVKGTPLDYPNARLANLAEYHHDLVLQSETDLRKCYEWTVTDITVLAPDDEILIRIPQYAVATDGQSFMLSASKRIENYAVHFSTEDFQ